MAATGAIVGPPAPLLRRAASSVMPKNGVTSAPEYVVGMATCGSMGRASHVAPGTDVAQHRRDLGDRTGAEVDALGVPRVDPPSGGRHHRTKVAASEPSSTTRSCPPATSRTVREQ